MSKPLAQIAIAEHDNQGPEGQRIKEEEQSFINLIFAFLGRAPLELKVKAVQGIPSVEQETAIKT